MLPFVLCGKKSLIYQLHFTFFYEANVGLLFHCVIFELLLFPKHFRPVEVRHDDGDGEGDAQNAADCAQRGNELPRRGLASTAKYILQRISLPHLWGDVAVASAGHGDDGPVQSLTHSVSYIQTSLQYSKIPEAKCKTSYPARPSPARSPDQRIWAFPCWLSC